jgi:predicted nucleic acid-binding protein
MVNLQQIIGLYAKQPPRTYLDTCCLGRAFDDSIQPQIGSEQRAMLLIKDLVEVHDIELVWSFILSEEVGNITNDKIRNELAWWKNYAAINVKDDQSIRLIAATVQWTGLREYDALHIACAKVAQADFFVTTDKRLLKYKDTKLTVCNPIDFLALL